MGRSFRVWGLGALGLILLLLPRPFLVLSTVPAGEWVASYPVWPKERFTVAWIHSVERTPWRETYEVGWPGSLVLSETAFQSFGAGVPSDIHGLSMRVEHGWVVARGLKEQRDEVVYLISRPDYTLMLPDRTVELPRLVSPGTSLSFAVHWRPWWYSLGIGHVKQR